MECKRHPSEQGVGICASCLQERLLAILAAQNDPSPAHHCDKPDTQPSPPLFSRPASSYPSHLSRSSPQHRHRQRFFSTPKVGHATAAAGDGGGGRRNGRRISLLSDLLSQPGSEEKEPDPGISMASGSSSWLSALIRGRRRRKKSRPFSADEEWPERRRGMASCRTRERGMSPVMDESDCGPDSGHSTASSGTWRMPTPSWMMRVAAAHNHHGDSPISGFTACLSPLVRLHPGLRRGQALEIGSYGEPRGKSNSHPHNHLHASGGSASLVTNRSRKLADLSRFR